MKRRRPSVSHRDGVRALRVVRALAFPGAGRYKAGMIEEDARKTGRQIQRLLREALALTKSLAQPPHVPDAEASSSPPAPSRLHVERYGGTRYYALYDGNELLAVTVYRKGAETVRARLHAHEARIAAHTQGQGEQAQDSPEHPGAVARLQRERQSERRRQR